MFRELEKNLGLQLDYARLRRNGRMHEKIDTNDSDDTHTTNNDMDMIHDSDSFLFGTSPGATREAVHLD